MYGTNSASNMARAAALSPGETLAAAAQALRQFRALPPWPSAPTGASSDRAWSLSHDLRNDATASARLSSAQPGSCVNPTLVSVSVSCGAEDPSTPLVSPVVHGVVAARPTA